MKKRDEKLVISHDIAGFINMLSCFVCSQFLHRPGARNLGHVAVLCHVGRGTKAESRTLLYQLRNLCANGNAYKHQGLTECESKEKLKHFTSKNYSLAIWYFKTENCKSAFILLLKLNT